MRLPLWLIRNQPNFSTLVAGVITGIVFWTIVHAAGVSKELQVLIVVACVGLYVLVDNLVAELDRREEDEKTHG